MQATFLKKILFFTAGLLAASPIVKAKEPADSLFAEGKYVQALSGYEHLLRQQGQASPAMLLRMAFVTENLGDYPRTLYYLDLYQQRRPSQQVALKMNELAARQNLRGYDYGDWDLFLIVYRRYYLHLVLGLAVLAAWMLAGMVRKKVRGAFVAGRHGTALFLFLGALLLLFNLQFNSRRGIVAHDYTYLMNAPSAGGKLVRVVRRGHRVPVRGQQDIWLRTEWAGQPAYVRKQQVWLVE